MPGFQRRNKMSIDRIKAIILQEIYITRHSLEVIIDLPYFSLLTLFVNGLIFFFVSKNSSSTFGNYLILGMLFWDIIRVTQYTVTVGSLWNIWSRNLSNMFIAPLSIKEYIFSHMLSGLLKSIFIFLSISFLALWMFKFNVFSIGLPNIFLFFINLTLFAWSFGIILLGIIFKFGTRVQALAWGLVFIIQPLTAPYFPVAILPEPLKIIAYSLPPTYVFEAAREALTKTSINWEFTLKAFGLNILYFAFAIWFFGLMFKKSKETGQFARNEG